MGPFVYSCHCEGKTHKKVWAKQVQADSGNNQRTVKKKDGLGKICVNLLRNSLHAAKILDSISQYLGLQLMSVNYDLRSNTECLYFLAKNYFSDFRNMNSVFTQNSTRVGFLRK